MTINYKKKEKKFFKKMTYCIIFRDKGFNSLQMPR